MARKKATTSTLNPATASFNAAIEALDNHPMFAPLLYRWTIVRAEGSSCPPQGWGVVTADGYLHVHPKRRADPDEWVYVLAHCLLHLGFGHFEASGRRPREWGAACDVVVARFLAELKLGWPPTEVALGADYPRGTEEELYRRFCEEGVPAGVTSLSLAGPGRGDMLPPQSPNPGDRARPRWWRERFAIGLAAAVTSAVNVASGIESRLGASAIETSTAARARAWFISSYPLLGSLAAAFKLVEDSVVCGRMGISVAAVDAEMRELYVNPAAGLDESESRFVMAHELLHVALRHQARTAGREPFLWNVACDYVINGWLVEMAVGHMPQIGLLFDQSLKGLSADAIYLRIASDLRRYRRLATLRGVGLGDMVGRADSDWWNRDEAASLDDLYRRCLGQGLVYHEGQGRGTLPADLVEEIRALAQPPVPWDVELARWFDRFFQPLETTRSYARPSRRQSATPDIPRPRTVLMADADEARTFGVVLDTSGSMDRALLARALGAVASYGVARDVAAVRVVFCDAVAYDAGYLPPEAIGDRVQVRGRGGTVLQPGIDLLESAEDFPPEGPVLVITDGVCDRVRIRREHAFLVPAGARLPLRPAARFSTSSNEHQQTQRPKAGGCAQYPSLLAAGLWVPGRCGGRDLSGVLRVYLRYHPDPIEILHAVEAYPATFRNGAAEYLSVQSDAKDVIAVVPIGVVVGWIYEPEPDTFTPRTRVQLRGYSDPVEIGTFARPVVKGEEYAALDGWTAFRDLGGRIVAWFRDDLLVAWQFIGGKPQER